MSRPLLQLALDHTSLQAAQRDVATLSDHATSSKPAPFYA